MVEFIISAAPICVLLVTLLIMKMPARKASAISFAIAMAEFLLIYRPETKGVAIAIEKGLAMSISVGLIAVGAMLLYNLVDMAGGFNTIKQFLSTLFEDRFALFLMICWTFTAFLQGIAGYGLPAVIAATILIKSGYDTSKSAAAALLGHSWAISFGSMGSSIFGIEIVTDTPLVEILVGMSKYGSIGMLACGMGICFIYGGFSYILKGLKFLIPAWITMSVSLAVMAKFEMVTVIGFVTGMVGLITMMVTYRIVSGHKYRHFSKDELRQLFDGVLPYLLVIVMSIGFFIINPGLKLSIDVPGYEMAAGKVVAAEEDFVTMNLIKFPFTIILITVFISLTYYHIRGILKFSSLKTMAGRTYKKVKNTVITLILLLCTTNIMMDCDMIINLSSYIVAATGRLYPFMAAVLGATGTFITGSNTNSNILFGSLQENAAIAMGVSPALMCACQSIAASVTGAIGPSTTSIVSASVGLSGKEGDIYKYSLGTCLAAVAALGIMNMIII